MSKSNFIYSGLCGALLLGLMWAIASDASGLCNDTSRLATADALVNHGTFSIDKSVFFYTCDRIKVDGIFFSDKPPFLSLFYALLLFLLQSFLGLELPKDIPQIYKSMTLLSSGLAFCGIVVMFFLAAQKKKWSTPLSIILALLCASCTQLFVFASVLNSHIIAATLLLWFWVRIREGHQSNLSFPGFLLGATVVIDPLAISFIIAWFLVKRKTIFTRTRFLPLFAGGLIPVLIHSLICWSIAGNLMSLNLNPEHFKFVGSIHNSQTLTGVGLKHDSLRSIVLYAYDSLLGHHGFFVYNTLTIFGLMALFYRKAKDQEDFYVITLTFILFFGLTIGFSDNHSGSAYGNRWHVLLVPLALYSLFCLEPQVLRQKRQLILLFAIVACWGLGIARIGLIDPWTPYFLEKPSFVVQFDSGSPYWDHEQKMSDGLLKTGHLHEAIHFGELALRRDQTQLRSWASVVTAAISLKDIDRLQKYESQISEARLPSAFKKDILAAIRQAQKE
jgi:hypothetical protein